MRFAHYAFFPGKLCRLRGPDLFMKTFYFLCKTLDLCPPPTEWSLCFQNYTGAEWWQRLLLSLLFHSHFITLRSVLQFFLKPWHAGASGETQCEGAVCVCAEGRPWSLYCVHVRNDPFYSVKSVTPEAVANLCSCFFVFINNWIYRTNLLVYYYDC